MARPSTSRASEQDHIEILEASTPTQVFNSFIYAGRGILYVLRNERNARIHLVFAVLAFISGVLLGLTNAELAAVFFAILLVFLAEVINTAFEKTLDLIDRNHNPQIQIIKDMAAGAVLIAALGAIAVGVVTFTPYVLGAVW